MRHEPWLTLHAQRTPERVALEAGDRTLTYAELHERASRAAEGMRAGERVAIALPPGIDFAVALHACLLAGAAAVPVDLRDPGAPARGVAKLAAPADQDTALVVRTSGTTAEPREIQISFANVYANALGSALALGLDRRERWLCPLPLTHVGGLMVLLRSLVYGTTAIVMPPPFDAAALAARLGRGDATLVSLVPTMLARALDHGLAHPPNLRAILLGGGPADAELLARAAAAGVPVAQTYGLTEATSQVTVSAPGDTETAGWPIAGVTLRLAPDGEILVEGPTVAGGGVLHTGDLGRIDERGRLSVVGRKADTIVSGGENVAPGEVEAALLAHPDVAEAAVFGRPDAEWGEAVTALVVPRDGAQIDAVALREHCAQRLAPFKVPKSIEAADVLPRTPSGKLLRRTLR